MQTYALKEIFGHELRVDIISGVQSEAAKGVGRFDSGNQSRVATEVGLEVGGHVGLSDSKDAATYEIMLRICSKTTTDSPAFLRVRPTHNWNIGNVTT